ncbi:MAG: sensor histidine kinase [Sphingomonadales bacterium]|nr:sensor histidine kinase [Sphingomonadales bacterium]MBD3773973.1 sensor histidine kinase [Paracoccaceae bacterium]
MHFDDRLATVLRTGAAGDRARRTQYRQLLDLLGSAQAGRDASLREAAWLRLETLDAAIPESERVLMVRDPGLRLRNPELVARLAEGDPALAAAALARAELSADQWEALVPALPIRARGFLRLRRGLPESTIILLERLGVHDRGLPLPESKQQPAASDTTGTDLDKAEHAPSGNVQPFTRPAPANDLAATEDSAIGALVKRIEAFQKARTAPPQEEAPQLPLGEQFALREKPALGGFAFSSDTEGRIEWAEGEVLPMVFGLPLAADPSGEIALAIRRRQPLRSVALAIEGAPLIAGEWIVDATPCFAPQGGGFIGHAGRFRRLAPAAVEADSTATAESTEADRIRQLLHELRTPVNAIQGFAEVIQQQLFGPTPHEYRALAANIAGDAARMLAGFDELDRLAKLETGALQPEPGEADFAQIMRRQLGQLQTVLAPRTAGFDAAIGPAEARIPLSINDAEGLAWRLLATLAGAMGAGEHCELAMVRDGERIELLCELPVSLSAKDDLFAATGKPAAGPLSAGMFGAGFALRLVRAEAQAMGGSAEREDDWLHLTLPLLSAAPLTRAARDHSEELHETPDIASQ